MSDCPSSHQLSQFLAGEIPDETQRQEIDSHVQRCVSCTDTLAELSASEATFIEQLRAVPVEPFEDESACDDVVRRVTELGDPPEPPDNKDDLRAEEIDRKDSDAVSHVKPIEQIGPYEIIRRLGHGGMGTVYLARHVHLNRAVALKVLRKVSDPDSIARFVHEMHAIGAIDHPNIVSANDSGIADGQHFLVMQLIPGIDGSQLARHTGPLPVADACEIVRQAAIGLQHIHELGMVHRDIKPGNLMLQSVQRTSGNLAAAGDDVSSGDSSTQESATDAQTAIVKILDLGLALIDESTLSDDKPRLTATGQVLGTLDYMAPEQCLDSRNVDIRADIYGLGATLFKLLTGDVPYPDSEFDTFGRKFTAILNLSPATVTQLRDNVPESLSEFVDTLLARNPDARPRTPMAVAEQLAPFAKDHQLAALIADTTEKIDASEGETNANTSPRVGFDSSIVPMSPAELAELRGDSRRNKGTLIVIGLGFVGLTAAVIWAAVFLGNAARPTNDAPLIPQGPQSPKIAAAPFDATEAVSVRESWAEWLETESTQTNSLGMELKLIPPGEFTMGDNTLTRSTSTGDERIAPEHHVAITQPYAIATTEVNQSQYREVMGKDPSEFSGQDDWPVEKITWDDAVRFCNALSQRDGLPLYYRIEPLAITIIGGTGYRLPTEAEWEFAARAGSETLGLSDDASVPRGNADAPSSVLSGEPNAFGLFHTAGNVSEFCQDGGDHGLRSTASATDPTGLMEGTLRVVKGGDFAQQQIPAAFELVYPFRPCFRTGFRVARTVPDPHEEPATDLPLIRQQLVDENLTGGGFLPVRLDDLATGTWEPLFDSPESLNGNREATWDDGTIDIQSNNYVFIESGRRTERHLIFRAEVRFIKGYSARLEISTAPIDKRMIAILKPGRIILGLKTGDGAKYIHCHSDFRPDIDRYVDIALVRNGNELAVYINGIRRCGSVPGEFQTLEKGLESMTPGLAGVSTNGGMSISFRNVRVMAFKGRAKTPHYHTYDTQAKRRAKVPDNPLPAQLDELATGQWIPLFKSADDLHKSQYPDPSHCQWSAEEITLTTLDDPKLTVKAYGKPHNASRIILRVLVNREHGEYAALAFSSWREGRLGGALKLVRYKTDYEIQFEPGHKFINEYPNRTPEPTGFEDLALVFYDDQIAVYVDGAKTMNFVKTPDMDGFFADGNLMLPWLGVYDGKKKAQSHFRDVRLMILE